MKEVSESSKSCFLNETSSLLEMNEPTEYILDSFVLRTKLPKGIKLMKPICSMGS